jgi:hypothetical protein
MPVIGRVSSPPLLEGYATVQTTGSRLMPWTNDDASRVDSSLAAMKNDATSADASRSPSTSACTRLVVKSSAAVSLDAGTKAAAEAGSALGLGQVEQHVSKSRRS